MQSKSDVQAAASSPGTVVETPQPNLGSTVRASWNFSRDNVREAMAQYPEASRTALMSLFLWCIDPRHPLAKQDAARRVGCSDNLLYKLLNGKYSGEDGQQLHPAPDLVRAIEAFLALEKDRFEGGETQFVMTPTAHKIATACEFARESQSVVFLWGPSQIGKTWGLEHHASAHNHGRTTYSRLQAASGLGGMVRRIARDSGISDKANTADLIGRIKNALTPETLLILDEVHLLAHTYRIGSFHACMEVIREIHDEAKVGMLLCFTLLDQMRAASQRELQQLWRRGVHKVPLPLMPTRADLRAIIEHCGLGFPERGDKIAVGSVTEQPYEVLRLLAKSEGLKAITERLRYGRKLANKAGDKLGWSHFVDAHLRIEKQAQQEGEWH